MGGKDHVCGEGTDLYKQCQNYSRLKECKVLAQAIPWPLDERHKLQAAQ